MNQTILRTFIAVELDEPLRAAIARVQNLLKREVPPGSVKWVAPDGIHLTLKFLGDTPESRVPEVISALRQACAGQPAFGFAVEGRGCFPNCRQPRVIWVAVRDPGQRLLRLQAAVERCVAPLGWPTEERAFAPHLTLGRLAKGARPAERSAVGASVERTVVERIGAQQVSAVCLIKSDLQPSGAVYTRLASIPLEEARAG